MSSQLELIKQLHQNSPAPYIVCDNDFSILWANDYALKSYPQLAAPKGLFLLLSLEQLNAADRSQGFTVPLAAANHFAACFTPVEDGFLVSIGFAESEKTSPIMPQSINFIIGAVSNQLRVPLSNIFASASSLARLDSISEDDRSREMVENINQNSYSMLRFTLNFTAYMRHILNGESYSPAFVDLTEWFENFSQAVSVMTRPAGIKVNAFICDSPVIVSIDPKALDMAILNIISNCCKFSCENNVISITLKCDDNNAHITISDKGLGVPADVLPNICEPFFSYDYYGEPFSGCGLGLSVAQNAIAKSGGSFAISSALEKGTTVAISLPLASPDDACSLKSPALASDMLRDRFSTMQVLLSDSINAPKP